MMSPFADLYACHSIVHGSEYATNARVILIFTQWRTLKPTTEPLGVLAVVHGYTGESSWLLRSLRRSSPRPTCAIDHQVHGFFEGLIADIPDVNHVMENCIAFFDSYRARFQPGLPVYRVPRRGDNASAERGVEGLVLHGAMCGISDKLEGTDMKGSATQESIPDRSFKEEWKRKRKLALASPRRTVAQLRTAATLELLRICRELQGRFEEVEVPLLSVHGVEDVVCAEELYQRAQNEDKTMKVYPEMWHQLIGEPQESMELVFGDIKEWLLARARV